MQKEQVAQVVQEAWKGPRKVRITFKRHAGINSIIRLIASNGQSILLNEDAETALKVFALHNNWWKDEDRTMVVTLTGKFEEDRFVDIVEQACETIEVWQVVKPINPDFPANRHNLVNGSVLVCIHAAVKELLGIAMGAPVILGWTGKYVRFGEFTWDVEDICQEIDDGYWRVVEEKLDFSDPSHLDLFSKFCSPALDGIVE